MDRTKRQNKDDRIVFRIQNEYMEELTKRAEESGVTPHLFARMLVQDALKHKKEEEFLKKLNLIEDRFDELRSDIMYFIKEIFIALGYFSEEEIENLISEKFK
jgi:hypothetical protein